MNYWLDLFTGTTWTEFPQSGSIISGFRKRLGLATSLKPDFLQQTAKYFADDDQV